MTTRAVTVAPSLLAALAAWNTLPVTQTYEKRRRRDQCAEPGAAAPPGRVVEAKRNETKTFCSERFIHAENDRTLDDSCSLRS
jgi:hypothetical protein